MKVERGKPKPKKSKQKNDDMDDRRPPIMKYRIYHGGRKP